LPIVALEALACGDDVILTKISGVKEWFGDTINNTKKIDYVELPAMIGQGVPKEDEVLDFEKRLAKSISSRIDLISHRDKKDELSMRDKTWDALAVRIEKISEGLITKYN